jgi:hypothetical protein
MIDSSFNKFYYQSGYSLDAIELNGLENISIEKTISLNDQFLLGGYNVSSQINSPQQIDLNFSRSFVESDDMLNLTGKDPINNAFLYNGSIYYYLKNLYLNNYSAGFSVGELPKISTKFISYGEDIAQVNSMNYNGAAYTKKINSLDIPTLGSISITGYSSELLKSIYNIFSFDYSLDINRQAYYTIGSLTPTEVCEILPIKINFSVNSKIKKESDIIHIPSVNSNLFNFYISVSGKYSVFSLPITRANLISTQIQDSSSNTLEIKRNFIGLYGL